LKTVPIVHAFTFAEKNWMFSSGNFFYWLLASCTV